jgi:hypothetical protein
MLVQTYALWKHRPQRPRGTEPVGQPNDAIAGFIDDLIARVMYYPSFTVQIAPDAQGRLVAGAQPVVQVDEQRDGMVVLRTQDSALWITHAAYHQLVA